MILKEEVIVNHLPDTNDSKQSPKKIEKSKNNNNEKNKTITHLGNGNEIAYNFYHTIISSSISYQSLVHVGEKIK